MGCWFLAPDFTFSKDGPIRLGAVLKDPRRPTLILAAPGNGLPDDLALPAQSCIEETGHKHSRDAATSGHLSLWADFLKQASASAHADLSRNHSFGKADHQVWMFDREFSGASLRQLVAVPKVDRYIHSGFLASRRPVYVITGIRVAKTSFEVSSVSRATAAGDGAVAVGEPSGATSLGAGGGAQRTRPVEDSYNTAAGIVFAYQVHILRSKRDGDVEEELFSHKAA